MFLRISLIVGVLLLAACAFAGNFATENAFLSPEGNISRSLDNQEPDTLQYDGDASFLFFSSFALVNYWTYVRFTTPADFQLRSLYCCLRDSADTGAPCSLWVYTANGTNPGTLLSSGAAPVAEGSFWYDVTLPDSVNFTANQDFFVVLGRCVGRHGWSPLLENANANRSFYSQTSRTTGYSALPYNLHIRAGGSVAAYTDMRADQCYDSVTAGRGYFNLTPNAVLRLKSQVSNLSTVAVDAFTVDFFIYDPNGTQVFTNEAVGATIQPAATQVVRAGQTYTVTTAGEYIAKAIVHADNDAVADNDTTWLRFFVGGYPNWYRYDDNGESSEGSISFPQGNMEGVAFRPAAFPAKIDTVRVFVSGDDAGGRVKIYRNVGTASRPGATAAWTSTAAGVVAGWNNIAVTPPVVMTSGSFTVAYMFGTDNSVGLGKDANLPTDAIVTRMDTTTWANDGTAWTGDITGNWMLQAHLDTSGTNAVGDHETTLPSSYSLAQNFPNPFNPTTEIQFTLPVQSQVRLTVYDVLGQEVRTLVNGSLTSGVHTVSFDAATLPSGIYFYRLEAGSFTNIRKMMLMK